MLEIKTKLLSVLNPDTGEYESIEILKGDKGDMPVKGTDYWTPADQEAIVQDVIAALGTPVFGRVDENGDIVLTGELAQGTYTVKYEDAEGDVQNIGTVTIANAAYTNLADQTSEDWLSDKRINSSGALKDAPGWDITNFIPVNDTSILHIKGVDVLTPGSDNNNYGRLYFYSPDKTYVYYSQPNASETTKGYFATADYDADVCIMDWPSIKYYYANIRDADIGYIRLGGEVTSDKIIITDGEEIK